jgi:hypothetical protein
MKKIFEQKEFVFEKFTDATTIDHIKKLIIEANELKKATLHEHPDKLILDEYADCLLCVFGAAAKEGFSYNDLVVACNEKIGINLKREWIKLSDGTYQHLTKTVKIIK